MAVEITQDAGTQSAMSRAAATLLSKLVLFSLVWSHALAGKQDLSASNSIHTSIPASIDNIKPIFVRL